jgi:hypothetical protein
MFGWRRKKLHFRGEVLNDVYLQNLFTDEYKFAELFQERNDCCEFTCS